MNNIQSLLKKDSFLVEPSLPFGSLEINFLHSTLRDTEPPPQNTSTKVLGAPMYGRSSGNNLVLPPAHFRNGFLNYILTLLKEVITHMWVHKIKRSWFF